MGAEHATSAASERANLGVLYTDGIVTLHDQAAEEEEWLWTASELMLPPRLLLSAEARELGRPLEVPPLRARRCAPQQRAHARVD